MNRPADSVSDGVYVEQVCVCAVAEFDRFLRGSTRPRNGAQLRVQVEITTDRRLSTEQQRYVDGQLERVRAGYRWVRYRPSFREKPGLSEPTCTARLTESDDPSPTAAPSPQPAPHYAVLTLRWESLTFAYVLTSRKQWVTLHRPDRFQRMDPDPDTDIVVPAAMSAVPTGPLLDVWYHEPTFGVRRRSFRPEIGVMVNGQLIQVGQFPETAHSGTIGYVDSATGRMTTLEYRLTPESWSGELRPSPGTAPPSGDSRPYRAVLTAGATRIDLDVQPPAGDARPAERRFPLPAPTQGGSAPGGTNHHDIWTWMLYTRATSIDGSQHWHVKLFRCATPGHARLLRTYLRSQALLIERVNRGCGGSPLRPPWAIAPVHVLPAWSHTPTPSPPTDFNPDPASISADPENRLADWFGVPGQPQPDCYVVVVSPELNRVTWRLKRDLPGHEQLPLLQSMAEALDTCHELGVAHGDIKPENVCFTDLRTGYVLVDGDSVTLLDAVRPALRFTTHYASRAMINRAADGLAPGRSRLPNNNELLTEHDRFGFILVVLTALAGSELVSGLLRRDENGDRDVDHPKRVRDMIKDGWSGATESPGTWEPLIAALAAPFERDALSGPFWSAAQWLNLLRAGYEESIRPSPIPAPSSYPRQPYDQEIRKIQQRLHQRGHLPRPDALNAVIEEVRAECRTVAVRAQARAFLAWSLIPVGLVALILVAVILGI